MMMFAGLEITASAMRAQRERLKVIASNLANASTTRGPDGRGPYRRRDVVFTVAPLEEDPSAPLGVKVAGVIEDPRPPQVIYDPAHPDADEKGFVKMPNINVVEEMTNLMMAFRAYEAAVAAFNTTKAIYMRILEPGGV